MNCLSALLLMAVAAYTVARPRDPTLPESKLPIGQSDRPDSHLLASTGPRPYPGDYVLPALEMPRYLAYDDSPQVPLLPPALLPDDDWLTKEIDRISQLEEDEEAINDYDSDLFPWLNQESYMRRILDPIHEMPSYPQLSAPYKPRVRPPKDPRPLIPLPLRIAMYKKTAWSERQSPDITHGSTNLLDQGDESYHRRVEMESTLETESSQQQQPNSSPATLEQIKQEMPFALTPLDIGYFDPEVKENSAPNVTKVAMSETDELGLQRSIRQNPNLSRTKTLVSENLEKLRTGLLHGDEPTDRPRHIHVLEPSVADATQSMYEVAVIAAVGAALTMAIVGFAFGWYTLSKKAKAAADVDYPAYGVTGPSVDNSGDRKLAHSAHMYHYQHQKQQIIALERNGMEQGAGSISDPESEEENEEGDYTVYECPGFATTGDMEVKNPLFSDDPTPATPGKCELVKPQPKD